MEIKIVFVGDGAVGKTSLIRSYLGKGLSLMMTVGVDFYRIKYDDKRGVVVWDLGGQEHFRPFVKDFIKGAFLVVLVFDLTRPETFQNIPAYWEGLILEELGDVPVILVGNKKDLVQSSPIKVSRDIVEKYIKEASKLNIVHYVETSAQTGEGVQELFDKIKELALKIIQQLESKYAKM